ncbi:hypothetical protein A5761_15165 [Mycolicibacterium setense]|uniref:hypothetical protein n=1 Tax=Mycolicibacterium setense TaxID=431269 RepID=UPI0007E9F443|nr:hypothetical protein [Mycolicibacterium setense]OBB15077.1 hypothetical protein A5761_15165 [Mycolicibacterium setense]
MNIVSAAVRAAAAGIDTFAECLFPGPRDVGEALGQAKSGPQWLTGFEEQREVIEPRDPVRLPAEFDTVSGLAGLLRLHGVRVEFDESSAVDTAADPSPACPSPSPASVGDEGPGEVSDILQSASPGQPDMHPDAVYGRLYVEQARQRKADPGEVSQPSPGEYSIPELMDLAARLVTDHMASGNTFRLDVGVAEQFRALRCDPVREDDLAAHITAVMSRFRWWSTAASMHWGDEIATDLLAEFNITRK